MCLFSTSFLNLFSYDSCSRSAYYKPTSCQPHLLIVGKAGYGQVSYFASAVLHALEKFPIHTLDLSILFTNIAPPEEICRGVCFFLFLLIGFIDCM